MRDGDTLQVLQKGYDNLQGLTKQIEQGTIPHAILLVGPPSVSAEVAAVFAKMILCESSNGPCGECVSCREMEAGMHPDFFQVQAEDSAKIKTADIGGLQAWLAVRPHYNGRKVYIIHGIDTATPIAANRLLKTLEEPNQPVIALLTAVHASLILPTIRSRCFQYVLTPDSEHAWRDAITSELLQKNLQNDNEGTFAGFLEQMVQWTETWVTGSQSSLVLADQWVKISAGLEQSDALIILSAWLRDLMHICVNDATQLHFEKFLPQMKHLAKSLSAKRWGNAISLVIQTRLRVEAHVALLLNIEQMCIRLQEVMRRV
jgi:DNA polymerase III subunit delta'